MAIFLGVSAAPKRILLSEFSYASVQHSLSQPESFIVVPNSPFKIDPRSVSSKDISLIPTYYIPRFLSIN